MTALLIREIKFKREKKEENILVLFWMAKLY